jgi:hypothetical protein
MEPDSKSNPDPDPDSDNYRDYRDQTPTLSLLIGRKVDKGTNNKFPFLIYLNSVIYE